VDAPVSGDRLDQTLEWMDEASRERCSTGGEVVRALGFGRRREGDVEGMTHGDHLGGRKFGRGGEEVKRRNDENAWAGVAG